MLLVLVLAGFVLTVAAGLVPAAFPILVRFAILLVGSVWRLGALLAGFVTVQVGKVRDERTSPSPRQGGMPATERAGRQPPGSGAPSTR